MEKKIRIMAVDDSKVSLLTIKRHLEGTDFELAATMQSAGEALAKYDEIRPDIVLLDVVMPDMDGPTLLQKLREHDGQARVIMVSSLGTKEKVMECMEKGAQSFLMKPYDKDGLITVLRAASPGRRGVSAKFFGQFLLERGAISGEQLLAAVAIQETTNVLLGTRAIDAGLMTAAQVETINLLQRTVDRRFGELAVERGFVTEEQLKELLSKQKEQRVMLGEALLRTGALDNARLADELTAFKRDAGGVPGTVAEIYVERPDAAVLEIVADVAIKLFLRIVHMSVRAGGCHDRWSASGDYALYQRITGDVDAIIALDVSSEMVQLIAATMLGQDVGELDADALDGAGEFLNIICGNICARLSATGRKVDLQPPSVQKSGGLSLGKRRITATPLLHPDETIELVVAV